MFSKSMNIRDLESHINLGYYRYQLQYQLVVGIIQNSLRLRNVNECILYEICTWITKQKEEVEMVRD